MLQSSRAGADTDSSYVSKQAGEWSSFATLGKSIGSLCTVAAGESINNVPQGFQNG